MADYGRGAKAGAIAGVVTGIIEAIGTFALFSLTTDAIKTALQSTTLPAGVTIDQLVTLTQYIAVISVFIGSIIGGAILGIIFAAVYNKYMTSKSLPMRGIVFGIILWLIGIVLNIGSFSYGTTYVAVSIIVGLVSSLIYGYLLGHFFKPKQAAQPTPSPTGTM
jgi:CBS domain containing-hemolysin-like protein